MDEPIAKVEIWATEAMWLKESDWKRAGFKNLGEYIKVLAEEGDEVAKRRYKNLPLVVFGRFDYRTGEKEIVRMCEEEADLPKEGIEGILEFEASN